MHFFWKNLKGEKFNISNYSFSKLEENTSYGFRWLERSCSDLRTRTSMSHESFCIMLKFIHSNWGQGVSSLPEPTSGPALTVGAVFRYLGEACFWGLPDTPKHSSIPTLGPRDLAWILTGRGRVRLRGTVGDMFARRLLWCLSNVERSVSFFSAQLAKKLVKRHPRLAFGRALALIGSRGVRSSEIRRFNSDATQLTHWALIAM